MHFARHSSAAKFYLFYAKKKKKFLLLSGKAKDYVTCTAAFTQHFCPQANKVRKKQRCNIKVEAYISSENQYSHTRKGF